MKISKIYLASDHAGFKLKTSIKAWLESQGYEVVDKGAHTYNKPDDYPDFITPAAKAVSRDKGSRGIISGYSGQGEAIAANRIKGVRAVVYYSSSTKAIKFSREHNDANVLSIGAGFVSEAEAKRAIRLWLSTPFSKAPRHKRRIRKLG